MTAAQIVVVGSYNRDVSFSVARLPTPGETCLSLGRLDSPGGKGSNQAIQAARCGAATAMIAAVGTDAAGDAALALWVADGIATQHVVRLTGHPTGMATILVDATAENMIVVDSGANAHLAPAHIEAASDLISAARVVVARSTSPNTRVPPRANKVTSRDIARIISAPSNAALTASSMPWSLEASRSRR